MGLWVFARTNASYEPYALFVIAGCHMKHGARIYCRKARTGMRDRQSVCRRRSAAKKAMRYGIMDQEWELRAMDNKKSGKLKHGIYILIAAGMLFYAFSDVGLAELEGAGGVFWFLWLAFSVVILAANANMLLMTQEKREGLAHVKRAKIRRREQAIERYVNRRANEKVRRVRGR
ncbi:MAG: hypothetical protein K0Q63_1605 [Paenibacillus sp.]|nr:hypothetical protein [Paenibacillus sp.]